MTVIWGMVPEIWRATNITFLSFWVIFSPLTPLTTQKIKILKKWKKKTYGYHHFTHVYQKLWSHDTRFLRYGFRQMDGQMGRWKKWHKRRVPHLKIYFWNILSLCWLYNLNVVESETGRENLKVKNYFLKILNTLPGIYPSNFDAW